MSSIESLSGLFNSLVANKAHATEGGAPRKRKLTHFTVLRKVVVEVLTGDVVREIAHVEGIALGSVLAMCSPSDVEDLVRSNTELVHFLDGLLRGVTCLELDKTVVAEGVSDEIDQHASGDDLAEFGEVGGEFFIIGARREASDEEVGFEGRDGGVVVWDELMMMLVLLLMTRDSIAVTFLARRSILTLLQVHESLLILLFV